MSRRKLQLVRNAVQSGATVDDARKAAVRKPERLPWRIVDAQTSVTIQKLSVRKSRAKKQALLFGADARLVR